MSDLSVAPHLRSIAVPRGEEIWAAGLEYTADKLNAIESYAEFCAGHGVASHPLEVFLEVSNVCDLKCAMCWQFSALNTNRLKQLRTQDRGFLDTVNVSENLEQVLRGALLVHCFGFGEPTLHPSFRLIIDQIARHGCMTDFYTNGMHLDQALCDFLVERSVSQIVVSFSGASKDIYENIYMGGDFERVLSGIRRLAEAKKLLDSPYPAIHINSVGFEDHVARFDDFVELMAQHGANVVHLRKLDVHPHMPHLFEHVSIMRADHEQVIIDRAIASAQRLGIRVDVESYARHAAVDQVDYLIKQDSLREAVHTVLTHQDRWFGGNPVAEFQSIAKRLPMARDVVPERTPPAVLDLGADRTLARSALYIGETAAGDPGEAAFYCTEPFKTLYVTRNGPAKPCCFAATNLFLGDVKKNDALDVWRGHGYGAVREGIANGEYPDFCSGCLKNKSAPNHAAGPLVEMYLSWHEAKSGPVLRAELDNQAPDAYRTICEAQPAAMMTLLRGNRYAADLT